MTTKTEAKTETKGTVLDEPPFTVEQAVVQAGPKAVAVNEYGDDTGAGFENVSRDELIIPFIRILQGLSPEIKKTESKFIPGAEEGMLVNTATMELYPAETGVLFVPCFRSHTYGEFTPRTAGGGFHGVWADNDPRLPAMIAEQGKFKKLLVPGTNHELIETYSLFGLVTDGREKIGEDMVWQQAVIGFSSTQIRAYKIMMARMKVLLGEPATKPLFAYAWHLPTAGQKNAKGSFFGWTPRLYHNSPAESLLPRNSLSYEQARAFHYFLKDGAASKVNYADAGAQDAEDELPF